MTEILVIVGIAILLAAFSSWRLALLLSVFSGFAQDVVRKLLPGEPVYLVLLFVVVFAVAVVSILMQGKTLTLGPIFRMHPRMRSPVIVFVAIVFVQILVTAATTGSAILAGIGAVAYLLPFGALAIAMHYASSTQAISRLIKLYIFMSVVFGAGIYLNVMGYQSGILDSVGEGLYIYPKEGGVLKLPSGFYRAAETAAWHGATAAALVGLLVVCRLMPGGALAGALVMAFLIGTVIFTVRRKMVVELVIFVIVFVCLMTHFRGRRTRLSLLLGLLAMLAFLGQLVFVPEQGGAEYRRYVGRYTTVAGEASRRLKDMTINSFAFVVQRNGLLGAGAGVGSQGAQHFGGGTKVVGYSAEGGVSKVLAELGVPGLIAAAWVAFSIGSACFASIRRLGGTGDVQGMTLSVGLVALLISNLTVFATASQVFGDPFVLLILGLMTGFVLRLPSAAGVVPSMSAPRSRGLPEYWTHTDS